MQQWATEGGVLTSLAILPLDPHPGRLRPAIRRLRRRLRDIRDRQAGRSRRWRGVAVAGMARSDDHAAVLVRHDGVGRAEVVEVLRRHWPDAVVTDVPTLPPPWDFGAGDAVELARTRRGIEPLRIVVLPQLAARASYRPNTEAPKRMVEPMPFTI